MTVKQKIVAQVVVTIGAFVVWYLIFAFVALDMDPAKWGKSADVNGDVTGVARGFFVFMSLMTSGLSGAGIWI